LKEHPEVSDLLITGGDPLIMTTETLRSYLEPILLFAPTVKSIRIGTKALSYWPLRFYEDQDSQALLGLFEEVLRRGKKLTIVSHITHPREIETPYFERAASAVARIGCDLKVQTPLLRGINDDAATLATLWKLSHKHQIVPYYLYVARDTGAQHHFGVPLVKGLEIFNQAIKQSHGLVGTVRGPVMSTEFGKIQIVGRTEVGGSTALVLKVLQARHSEFSGSVHLAKFDESAVWLSDLTPLDGKAEFPFQRLG
jgi:L-lysine 2,3-aminomutase